MLPPGAVISGFSSREPGTPQEEKLLMDMGLEDQLLGQAVSCLRRWGHRTLSIWRTDAEPDGLLDRYGFQKVEDSWTYNLDPYVYHWEEAGQAVL